MHVYGNWNGTTQVCGETWHHDKFSLTVDFSSIDYKKA